MRYVVFSLIILLTSCTSIQFVQQEDHYRNQTLPITTDTHTKEELTEGIQPIQPEEAPDTSTDPAPLLGNDLTQSFRIIQTWPLDQADSIVLDRPIEVFFNKDVNPDTLNVENVYVSVDNSIRFYEGDPIKFTILNYDQRERLLTINSGAYDLYGETVRVTFTDNIQTVYNERLAPYSFIFTLEAPKDLPAFTVVETEPAENDAFVEYDSATGIRISYSNQVDQTTINKNTVQITLPFSYAYASDELVDFTVRIDYAKQSSFLTLDPGKTYNGETVHIKVTEGVKDTFGQALMPYEFEFTIKK